MYAITCAGGYVGKPLIEELLKKGKKVRAIDRDTFKLRELSHKGATPLAGDLNDPEFVKTAFKGAEAVVCIIPADNHNNDYRTYARNISKSYADSVRKNKVKNVILVSSIGAQLVKSAGIDGISHELENQFSQLRDVNVLNLRAGFWLENILAQIELVNHRGSFGSPIRGDIMLPQVCAMDIGIYSAKRLTELDFRSNTTEYLLGERDATFNETASIIGKEIGRPELKYTQLKPNEFIKIYEQIGFSENVARGIVDYAEALNNGKYNNLYKRTPQSTTPLSIETFAKLVFAEEYHLHEITA
jgi:uncharacterized protein YbjT (DUF2867 family)